MSEQERELVIRLIRQSVLTLCKETITYHNGLEVDGIVCITMDMVAQPIVVKIHERIKKEIPSKQFEGLPCQECSSLTFSLSKEIKQDLSLSTSISSAESEENPMCIQESSDDMGQLQTDVDSESYKNSTDNKTNSKNSLNTYKPDVYSEPECERSNNKLVDNFQRDATQDKTSNKASSGKHAVSETNRDDNVLKHCKLSKACHSSNDVLSQSENNSNSKMAIIDLTSVQCSFTKHAEGLMCKRCLSILPDIQTFDTHNLTEHSLFTCKVCFKSFTARNNLKRHFRLHTGIKPFKCHLCSQSYARKDDLKGHVLKHSYEKPFRCSICKKGYTDKTSMRNHMAVEHNIRLQYVCPQCGEGFDNVNRFSLHKKSHPEFMPFHCAKCDFIGINAVMHLKHALTHQVKTYTCNPCQQTFDDPFDYTSHLKQHKSDVSYTSYTCCFCSTELTSFEQFIRHEYSHAHNKSHTCPICFKQFRYSTNLKEHITVHNTDITSRSSQYWCTECQVGFSSEHSLQCHIFAAHESRRNVVLNKSLQIPSGEDSDVCQNQKYQSIEHGGAALGVTDIVIQTSLESAVTEDNDNADVPHALTKGIPMVDLSQTAIIQPRSCDSPIHNTETAKHPRMMVLQGINEHNYSESSAASEQQNGTVTANGTTMTIKTEVEDVCSSDVSLQSNLFHSQTVEENASTQHDYSDSTGSEHSQSMRQVDNGTDKSVGSEHIVLERIHIRAPGFERVVTPDVLFRSRNFFQCRVCDEVYEDFTNFEEHSRESHRRFVCEYCGKVFTAKPNRERHIRYHTGEKPFKCDVCEQTFFRGDDLKYHRTTRHSLSPYTCNSCGMSFAVLKDMERHSKHYCTSLSMDVTHKQSH